MQEERCVTCDLTEILFLLPKFIRAGLYGIFEHLNSGSELLVYKDVSGGHGYIKLTQGREFT